MSCPITLTPSRGRQRPARRPAGPPTDRPRPATPAAEEGFLGYDDEANSRYEEIKRGSTYITELQQMTMVQLQKLAKDEEHPARGVGRPQEAGPDLQDPQGAGQAERPDVRRGDARNPARRLRVPPQPGLQLPALPGRHLHLAQPDPPVRPAHRGRRRRPDPPAEGERALLRPAARRGDQLPGPGPAHAEGRLRRPDAAAPDQAAQAGDRPGRSRTPASST